MKEFIYSLLFLGSLATTGCSWLVEDGAVSAMSADLPHIILVSGTWSEPCKAI